MSNTTLEQLSKEDLIRVSMRDRTIKEQMSMRIASLVHENLELLALIHELQADLTALRQGQAVLNGEVPNPQPPADVTSS